MQLSLEFKEKIDEHLKLIGLNPFQHFFCFNESNIIKLGIACSKSSQCIFIATIDFHLIHTKHG